MIGNLRILRTFGMAVSLGAASVVVASGASPAGAAPVNNPAIGSKYDCSNFADQVNSLTARKVDILDRLATAQAEVDRLRPIVQYAEFWYGGMDFDVRSQTAYVQHLIDVGAPAADIAFHQGELARLTAIRDSYTPQIESLRKQLSNARSDVALVQQELYSVNIEINLLRRFLKSIGCPWEPTLRG
jgi:hypothetical protein